MLLKDKTIFLLEDDPINFSIIKTLLRQNGAAILHDHWGDSTLTLLKNYPAKIDLMLIDIMLPGNLTGYDILDQIRGTAQFDDVPVAFVSASDPDIEIPKAKAKNANGYISKPIKFNEFPKQIYAILQDEAIWE